jgi:hypothetical protein
MLGKFLHSSLSFIASRHGATPKGRAIGESLKYVINSPHIPSPVVIEIRAYLA